MSESLTGAEFKKQLRAGTPKLGLFLNSHSPTVAEQLAHSGYDWLYTSPELNEATDKLRAAAKKNNVILGIFLFGTSRVGEFLEKGFPFISLGNDLHHVLTQSSADVKDVEAVSKEKGKSWTRRATALM